MKKKGRPALWRTVSGRELNDALDRNEALEDYIPPCEAVYLWRRTLIAPSSALASAAEFVAWLDEVLAAPSGEVTNLPLSHFALLDRLTIRSPGLTDAKRKELDHWATKSAKRKQLANYVHSLADFIPPLYCGEAENLPTRVKAHLSGDTGFGRKVKDGDAPAWSELGLAYYRVSDAQEDPKGQRKRRRTLLELIATNLSISGYVDRRG